MRIGYSTVLVLGVLSLQAFAQTPVDFKTIDGESITSDPSVIWRQFGPGGSGNNYYLFWHPTDPDTVFQGPNMGNSYRSTDRGESYEGILNPDGPGYKTRNRGPVEIYAPTFSHQDPNFGICTMEDAPVIFTTSDKGLTWEKRDRISQQFKGIHINSFAVDPTDDNIWYAGTGNVRDCNHFFFFHKFPHGGHWGSQRTVLEASKVDSIKGNHIAKIWKSTDRGENWKEITPKGINSGAHITRLFIHPARTKTIFAPTTYGLYVSTNGGNSWELKTETGLDNDIIRSADMHFDPKTKKVTLFVIDLVKYIPDGKTIRYNGGIFKSTDEGESWTNITSNMPLEKDLLKSYAIKKSYYKIALSKWFGKTEKEAQELYPELPEKLLHSVSMIRVNPSDVNQVMVVNNYKSQFTFSGGMLWRTDNGGKDWIVTLRNGYAWEEKDKRLWEARNNPTSHNVDWVGQDEWEKRDPYDRKAGASIEYNCDGSMIMFQVAKIVCVSTDGGDSWYENDDKETAPGSGNWVGAGNSNMPAREIIQDMRIKDHLYLCSGENTIWKTTGDGELVRPNAQAVYKINMPDRHDPEECSVSSMAIHPKDVNTFYSLQFRQAFFGKLMKSTNGGVTWTEHGSLFDPKDYGNPVGLSINQNNLLIDPDNDNRFYCAVIRKSVNDVTSGNQGKFKAFGVYRSLDGGVTFKVINSGLPSGQDVQKLAFDPTAKSVLFAAVLGTTNKPGGLYRLEDGSDRWSMVSIPKGMVSVHDIYFSQDNRLYISGGTPDGKDEHGGVWYTEDAKKWKQIFPYKYANHIRVAKYDPKVLMVSVPSSGSNILNPGVFRSLDKGRTWSKVNTGNLQSDRLSALEIDYFTPGIYWCSTYGAGYYKGIDESLSHSR